MSEEIALESPASAVARRQPLLRAAKNESGGSRRRSRMGETAGGCAAVCCCCPCGLMHVLLLAVYRVPRGLWRKKKREKLLRKKKQMSSGETEKKNHRKTSSLGFSDAVGEEEESMDNEECAGKNDVFDWDNEMWGRFYGAGFWRSASQRKDNE